MLKYRWFPWKQMVSLLARSRGLVDPVSLLARLERFGQPLEVREPIELLRSGLVFHARGLLNTVAIQHNLDWVWPFWVERQYDPHDRAFIPRAFSITHVNLTHRNWTAVGLPGCDQFPIVDPRGLVTPFWDSWSLDAWLFTDNGTRLFPSTAATVEQFMDTESEVSVVTSVGDGELSIFSRVLVQALGTGRPACFIDFSAVMPDDGWLIVALRPYNPEGVSFIYDVSVLPDKKGWLVDSERQVVFSRIPDRVHFSYYRLGDVKQRFSETEQASEVHCRVGMATAAALFRAEGGSTGVQVSVPLGNGGSAAADAPLLSWTEALEDSARLDVPDPLFVYLYDAAVRSLVLHSPGEIYPGPFTYKRFWFRDAVFMLNAMLVIGFADRVERLLNRFPLRQKSSGFFYSQEGEWDSNGEVLWLMQRYVELTGRTAPPAWHRAIRKGARWIVRKRLKGAADPPVAGLLPAGFSAEHLGPNDYYYWDDFWSVAGLRAAGRMLSETDHRDDAGLFEREADDLFFAIMNSLDGVSARIGHPGMPASPYRRMDPGAIGSLVAGYPLQLLAPSDARLLETARFIAEQCLVRGGFFHDVIHSGINPYLTLHLAQVWLRAGDTRALDLIRTVSELASPSGQWPEAIHPRTLGGCMGDGHHVWASAEWVSMLRNCFVREEGDTLIFGSGLFPAWTRQRSPISFGPSATPFGPVTVRLQPEADNIIVSWQATWQKGEPRIAVALPFYPRIMAQPGISAVIVRKEDRL